MGEDRRLDEALTDRVRTASTTVAPLAMASTMWLLMMPSCAGMVMGADVAIRAGVQSLGLTGDLLP